MKELSRRRLFQGTGALAGAGLLSFSAEAAAQPDPYEALGVRPLVNCRGTFTIITGSQTLPEVKRAMDAASRHYVHLDELMEAVGRRLAELTQADWGIVTAGCAAALTHATAACLAGADPEKMQRLPNLTGLKSEVVAPKYSRNEYDHAVRMLGVKMIEVETAEELETALGPKTAMIMILSSPPAERGPLSIENTCRIARRKSVPVIVDAAAETLTIPNIHLKRGANLVAYSGGKCLRGPQCAGLLLGQKDLVQAAWINSAPHHAFGRSLKVGKEEIMGMLAAVEAWVKRDHEAEWRQWESWLDTIGKRAKQIPSVTTEILQPEDLSNHAPRLRIHWDAARVGITGEELEKALFNGTPRVTVSDSNGNRRGNTNNWLTIMPYMMMPGDDAIAAERIYALLANPPKPNLPPAPSGGPVNIDGQWEARLTFVRGSSDHRFIFEQQGDKLVGTHTGDILSGDLAGNIEGDHVSFRSGHHIEGTTLHYDFSGVVEGDTMRGEVGLAEYGKAQFVAHRHKYRQRG